MKKLRGAKSSEETNTMQAIGVDLGGTNLRVGLIEATGNKATILREKRMTIAENRDPHAVAKALGTLVKEIAPNSGKIPIGVGIAGMFDVSGRIVVNAPNLGWRDVHFADLVEKEVGSRIHLENDANAISWGEFRFGSGHGFRNVVCVFIGTGVGGGAVLDGKLYRGGSNCALEVGHVRVVPGGRLCGCGAHGCLEAYAGGQALTNAAKERPSPILLEPVEGNLNALHAGHVDQAAQKGDDVAQQLIAQGAAYLAGALGDMAVLFNPDCIILGGTVWQNCTYLKTLTVHVFDQLDPAPARTYVKLLDATLMDCPGMIGAADLAAHAQ